MNIYPNLNFNKNDSVHLRSKRLRHVHLIFAKNLKITAAKFNVWFTLHLAKNTRAFYISEKKENDKNPKWYPLNSTKLSCKQFIVRIWYSNLDDAAATSRLTLLLETGVNMDCLVRLQEENLDYSIKSFSNMIFFEIFGMHFCEPIGFTEETTKSNTKPNVNMGNSYSLNLMVRLHDFQRVMHETSIKIAQLKYLSVVKFEASSKLRELQVKKEQLLRRIYLYNCQLGTANNSIRNLTNLNENLKQTSNVLRQKLANDELEFEKKKQNLLMLETALNYSTSINMFEEEKLRKRQKQMIKELASIFKIERIEWSSSGNTRNRMKIINTNFKSHNNNNLAKKNAENQNAVVLGYVIHSIQMLSNILNMPLRYPVIFRGSRSFIIEQMNEDDCSEYPLFKQNSVQDSSLAYAVSLLNKNLSQLRIAFDSFKNVDTSDMLGNLKWIFDNL
jgi:hypothetical protein